MNKLHPYQFSESKIATGQQTSNNLGLMFGNKTQFLKKSVTRLLSSEGIRNFNTLLDGLPMETIEEEEIYYWNVTGDSEVNAELIEARYKGAVVGAGDNNVGQHGGYIELVFNDEAPFAKMHMIVGEKNELYQLRIVEKPYAEGSNLVFTAELMGQNLAGMPGAELVAGKRFSKDFSPVEDRNSTEGGEISFTSPMRLGNELTTISIQHTVAGKEIKKVVETDILIKDETGKVKATNVWLNAVDWTLEKTWSQEKAFACIYARSNRSTDGKYHNVGQSGEYIKQGMGVREQQEVSNVQYFDLFSLPQLEAMISDLGAGRVDMGDRTILMRTGEGGASLFSKAVQKEASGWSAIGFDNTGAVAIRKTASELHSNAYGAGYQFTEYLAPNNWKIKIEVDPLYDNRVRNTQMAPHLGSRPAESYRFDIYYIGSSSEPNIYKVETTTGDLWGATAGFRDPWTGEKTPGRVMSHQKDSATYRRQGSFGVAIVDTSRTAVYMPSVLQ